MKEYFIDTEWDYGLTDEKRKNFFGDQNDFNYTILTKINECSTRLHMASPDVKMEDQILKIHLSLKFLFMPLEYYCNETRKIGERYSVEFVTDIEEDTIEQSFNNKKAKIKVIT